MKSRAGSFFVRYSHDTDLSSSLAGIFPCAPSLLDKCVSSPQSLRISASFFTRLQPLMRRSRAMASMMRSNAFRVDERHRPALARVAGTDAGLMFAEALVEGRATGRSDIVTVVGTSQDVDEGVREREILTRPSFVSCPIRDLILRCWSIADRLTSKEGSRDLRAVWGPLRGCRSQRPRDGEAAVTPPPPPAGPASGSPRARPGSPPGSPRHRGPPSRRSRGCGRGNRRQRRAG